MYYIEKRLEVAFAHRLNLDYESKCSRLHGHNAIVTVFCKAPELDANGMVVDFTQVKAAVLGKMDHKCLNDVFPFNPTAENLARWICEQVPHCYKVTFQESEGNIATYEREETNPAPKP